jgi:hypothetical protein
MGGFTADLCWGEVKDKDLVEVLFEPDIYKFGDVRLMIRRALRITICNILYKLTLCIHTPSGEEIGEISCKERLRTLVYEHQVKSLRRS